MKNLKLSKTWRPSEDVIEILTRAGMDNEFLKS